MSDGWKLLRVVVEVKVPPGNRSTEKDLKYHVEEALSDYYGGSVPLPRGLSANRYDARPRVKAWTPVFRYVVNHLPELIRRRIAMMY